jgi:hypothetical protein
MKADRVKLSADYFKTGRGKGARRVCAMSKSSTCGTSITARNSPRDCATVGIDAGKPFDLDKLSEAEKAEEALGVKEGYDSIVKQKDEIGKNVNGWAYRVGVGRPCLFQRQLVAACRRCPGGNLRQQC